VKHPLVVLKVESMKYQQILLKVCSLCFNILDKVPKLMRSSLDLKQFYYTYIYILFIYLLISLKGKVL